MKKMFLLLLVGAGAAAQANAQTPVFVNHGVSGEQTNSTFFVRAAPEYMDGAYIEMANNSASSTERAGSIGYIAGYNSQNNDGIAHTFYARNNGGTGWVSHLRILQSGKVQIGAQLPTTQTDYKLAVDGKLVTKSLFVTSPINWADFVFAPKYRLMPLPELETYLRVNRHLPAVPSASEVESKGYNVSEMDAKLLQSLEELTLHVIELNKQNQQLQAEMATLRKQVSESSTKQ